jgi:toxin FitB
VLAEAAQAPGRYPGFADIAIAAIAKSRDLVIVTLNLRHFELLGVGMLNPFDPD